MTDNNNRSDPAKKGYTLSLTEDVKLNLADFSKYFENRHSGIVLSIVGGKIGF